MLQTKTKTNSGCEVSLVQMSVKSLPGNVIESGPIFMLQGKLSVSFTPQQAAQDQMTLIPFPSPKVT